MSNRATFLGFMVIAGVIAAAIGSAMVLSSNDGPAANSATALITTQGGSFPAATGAPIGQPYAADIPNSDQNYSVASEDLLAPGSALAPAGSGVGGAGDTAGIPPAQTGGSGSIIDRKIERTSTLSVTVDNVLAAVSKIQAAATGAGGYVSQQSITEQAGPPDEDGKPTKQQLATVQIRVPSESYDNVMSGLRGIAKEVTSENSQTTEVTAQYSDLQSQLRNLQATEKQYLALLERAATIDEILTVGDRLASVRLQIEQVQGQVNLLDNLTSLATITINVTLPPVIIETVVTEPAKENFAEEAINNAWAASQDMLEFMAVAAITAGVVMVWILVPGVLGLAGWRLFGGRRGHGPAAS